MNPLQEVRDRVIVAVMERQGAAMASQADPNDDALFSALERAEAELTDALAAYAKRYHELTKETHV